MTDSSASDSPLDVVPYKPRRKGWVAISWLAIACMVGLIMWWQTMRAGLNDAEPSTKLSTAVVQFQARYLVGFSAFSGAGDVAANKRTMLATAKALNTGPIEQRLGSIIMAGELAGPDEALAQLRDLEQRIKKDQVKPTKTEEELMITVGRLYREYSSKRFDARSVSPEHRDQLIEELGWLGKLALAPADGPDKAARSELMEAAKQTVVLLVIIFIAGAFLGFSGLVALIVFLCLLFSGRLQHGIQCGTENLLRCNLNLLFHDRFGRARSLRLASKRLEEPSEHGGIYAETFAVWLLLFIGLGLAAEFLFRGDSNLLGHGLLSLVSLAALFWPIVRGISWEQVRSDIGLRGGKNVFLEALIGLGNYIMTLPLLGLCVVLLFIIVLVLHGLQGGGVDPADNFSPQVVPSHPVVQYIVKGDWWGRVQVFLLACVFAPFLEEIMFRGVLYRHLRELSWRWGYFLSVAASATAAGFVFAAVHPQGPIAIPLLMIIAIGLTIPREWRGTLIPGMVTHGVHNGIVMLLATMVLNGLIL
jgi:membrane protease YdiL (CAAX protease family)